MKIHRRFRLLIALAIFMITTIALLFIFFATQTAIDLWDKLQDLPEWLFYIYIGVIGLFIAFSLWMIIRLLLPSSPSKKQRKKLDEANLIEELEEAEDTGIDVEAIRDEIQTLNARKEAGKVYVALFGDVSTGKSSIIKSLIPDSNITTNIRGGSTQEITEYIWQSDSGDELVLTDLPGRNEASGTLDPLIQDEAIRSQVVVYVTDSDLSRTQFDDIQTLMTFEKPMILAINKVDRYSEKEQAELKAYLAKRFDKKAIKIALISSGGEEEIVRIHSDGREETVIRDRPANINELAETLQAEIDNQFETLNQLRDVSVFVLIKQKLDSAKQAHRHEQGERIVKSSTRKAVLGALAAISPGSDLVIQGVIGSLMIKDICKLYDVPVRQIDIDKFLEFSQGQLKSSAPLILAVAGNGLKAFPGIGTVAGGLVHAVSYGIIFNALGHAVLRTLEQRGRLQAAPAALTFKELLGENMESNAKLFARLVLEKDTRKSE